MRTAISKASIFVIVVASATVAFAARAGDSRNKADYVLTGTVTDLYKSDGGGYDNYIVEIKVEEVEKGKDIKPDDTFRAFCYKRTGPASIALDSAGHKTIPKPGERVKVYVIRARGRFEGTYPDWVDILPPRVKGKKKLTTD
jgi:hypothetical protein